MSDLSIIPLEDWFETQLAQDWNGATGTVYVLDTPSYTPTTTNTYIVVNPWKNNMQIAEITDYNSTANTLTVSSVTLLKGLGINSTAPASSHATGSKVIISDNYQFWADIQTAINSKLDKNGGNVQTYATTAARDTALGGDGVATLPYSDIYVTNTGLFYNYNLNLGQWQAVSTGTAPANATQSTAWVMKTSVVPSGVPVALITDDDIYKAANNAPWTPSESNTFETQFDTSNGSTYTATTISFTAGTKTISDSANGFVTAGFKQGTQIVISGTASNNGTFTIVSVVAWAIVVAETVVTESAGASVTITSVTAEKVYRLKDNGKIDATMLEWALPALDGSALTGLGDVYGSSTNLLTTYHNDIFKTTRPFVAAGSSISGVWFEYFNIDNASNGAVNHVWWTIKGTGSANSFIWSQSKKVRIRWNARYNTGSNNWWLWLAVTATSLGTEETDTTTGTARVLVKNGVLWFCTANGSYEATNVDSGITDSVWNEYMMEINPWVNIKLYINWNLVATHTTIPTTGTPSWTVGVSTGSSASRYMGLSNLNISYEL